MNQAQSTARTKRSSAPRRPAIPYPELPEPGACSSAEFWRAVWLQDLAQMRSLKEHIGKVWRSTMPMPLMHAMAAAQTRANAAANESLEKLIKAGGLLFAWVPEGGAP